MPSSYSLVLTACGAKEEAEKIAAELVEQRLAGCVQMFQIESVYRWGGAVERPKEWMLFCKIKAGDYDNVEAAIRALHSYATPEIIAIDIDKGATACLAWLESAACRG